MNPKLPLLLFSLLPIGLATALPSRGQELLNEAPVLWEPVVRSSAPPPQQLGGRPSKPAEEIVWELVPESKAANGEPSRTTNHQTEVVWSLVPETPQLAETTPPTNAGVSASTQQVVWEEIPGSVNPLGPTPSSTLATKKSADSDEPPADAVAFENSQPARRIPAPPPPPALQALNRSIAFGDGAVGPDLGHRVPNGFRWSPRFLWDATVIGYSYQEGRNPGDPLIPALDSGNLDGWALVHLNLLQTKEWSVALNTTFRSLQNNPNIPGGSTGITDGVSNGFRISRSLGDTAGISLGGEQVLQWDDKSDRGRNLYLAISKGWWLGNNGRDFPLFIANGGLGSGRLASFTRNHENNEMQDLFDFTCVPVESNRTVARIDENLCWGPFASINFVASPWWGGFFEYATSRGTLGLSVNLSQGLPIRLTGAVHIIEKDQWQPFDQQLWTVQASIGF